MDAPETRGKDTNLNDLINATEENSVGTRETINEEEEVERTDTGLQKNKKTKQRFQTMKAMGKNLAIMNKDDRYL
jgi:hypothetical protein